jgi:DNA-binding CsgD family transcriptional regulator
MNQLMQRFMKLSDPEQIFNIDAANFPDLSFGIFSKDLKGKYLFSNHFAANVAGFTAGNELQGLTDFDLPWSKECNIMRENDDRVKAEGKALSLIEQGTIHTGHLCRNACLKAPLRGHSKKIIGIIAISFILEEVKPVDALFPELSKQQIKCLYHLAQGMTMKQIGYTLGLSPKTVEHYLDAVKAKLNCQSRSELIGLAINLGILKQFA